MQSTRLRKTDIACLFSFMEYIYIYYEKRNLGEEEDSQEEEGGDDRYGTMGQHEEVNMFVKVLEKARYTRIEF